MSYYPAYLSQRNGAVSLPPLFMVNFCCFYFFPPHGLVRPLFLIVYSFRITLLSDHIIVIFHYFLCNPYWSDAVVSHSPECLSQSNAIVSPSRLFIVIFVVFHCFLLTDECYHSLWSQISSELLFRAIILSLHSIMYYVILINAMEQCRITQNFYSCEMVPYQRHVCLLLFL